MGIKDFFKVIIKNKNSDNDGKPISSLGKPVTLEEIAETCKLYSTSPRIAFDASWEIYRAVLALGKPSDLSSGGRSTIHINTILSRVIMFDEVGFQQLWIFDSDKPNPLKAATYEKRKNKKKAASEQGDEKGAFGLDSGYVEDIQKLLHFLGISYVVAPDEIEAEQFGAMLSSGPIEKRFCQYMLSGDSDTIIFGGNMLLPVTQKGKRPTYIAYDQDTIRSALKVDRDSLARVAVAMGSDFNDKIPGIGPGTVMTKLHKGQIMLDTELKKAYDELRKDISDRLVISDFKSSQFQLAGLREYLISKGFNYERLEKRILAYKNRREGEIKVGGVVAVEEIDFDD